MGNQTTLDGWDAYKFGMSPDQVRTIPGKTWGRLNRSGAKCAYMDSYDLAEFAGDSCVVSFKFDPLDKRVRCELFTTDLSAESCKSCFLKWLQACEEQYGAFSPYDSQPGAGVDALPGGRSRYSVHRIDNDNVILQAERTFGSARIFLEGSITPDSGGNLLSISYECETEDWAFTR